MDDPLSYASERGSSRQRGIALLTWPLFAALTVSWFWLWRFDFLVDTTLELEAGDVQEVVVSGEARPVLLRGVLESTEAAGIELSVFERGEPSEGSGFYTLEPGPFEEAPNLFHSVTVWASDAPARLSLRAMTLETSAMIGGAGLLLLAILAALLYPALSVVGWPRWVRSDAEAPVLSRAPSGWGVAFVAAYYAGGLWLMRRAFSEPPTSYGLPLQEQVWLLVFVCLPVLLIAGCARWESRRILSRDFCVVPSLRLIPAGLSLVFLAYAVTRVMLEMSQRLALPGGDLVDPGLVEISSLSHFPLAVLIALAAGICEELVFRGFLLRRLQELTGSRFAALILTSVGFGLIHWNGGWLHVWATTVLGLGFGAVALRWRNLLPVIWAHCCIDLIRAVYSGLNTVWGWSL